MADTESAGRGGRGGFGRGFGRGGGGGDRGDRGGRGGMRGRGRGGRDDRGRGGRGGARGGRRDGEEGAWVPVTKLGRLVKEGFLKSIEEVFLYALPIKEYQIIDYFYPKPKEATKASALKDEVMKIIPVQKQTRAGQRTRFKAYVVVGDFNGHVGLGVKCSKEVATAIRGAIIQAKIAIVPVRRGYWGNNIGAPHTVPTKVTGKVGSVSLRLVPAPRGTGIVAARVPKKLLQLAGIQDVYTQSRGSTRTLGNFVKSTFEAIVATYGYLTPDLWKEYKLLPQPFHAHSGFLAAAGKGHKKTRALQQEEGGRRNDF